MAKRRECDNDGGIARKSRTVGFRVPQHRGRVGAQCHPKGDRCHKQPSHITCRGGDGHRRQSPDQCSSQTKQSLADDHAGYRLRHDKDSHHCPLRLLQVQRKGCREGKKRRDIRSQRKYPGRPAGPCGMLHDGVDGLKHGVRSGSSPPSIYFTDRRHNGKTLHGRASSCHLGFIPTLAGQQRLQWSHCVTNVTSNGRMIAWRPSP